jgi:hypothetical protein
MPSSCLHDWGLSQIDNAEMGWDSGMTPHKAKFVSAQGLDHRTAWLRSDLVLPHIKEFLAKVSKT